MSSSSQIPLPYMKFDKFELQCLKLISRISSHQFWWNIKSKRNFCKAILEIKIVHSSLAFVAFHDKLKSQRNNKTKIAYIHLFKHLWNNSTNAFLQVIIFTSQLALNLLYCSTILLKCPRISTGISKWQLHWPMACDFPCKKDNKKRLSLLHIEADGHNPADNTVQYMISMPWLVPFLCGSLEYLVTTDAWKAYQLWCVSIVTSCETWVFYSCKVFFDRFYYPTHSGKKHDLWSVSQSRELSINTNKK